MKTKYFLFAGFLLIIFSCTKLDETPYSILDGKNFPETDLQLATMTVDVTAQLQPLIDDQGWWFLAQELSSDELCAPTRGADWFDGGKWLEMHKHTWTNDNEGVNTMWAKFWGGITTANKVLDKFHKMAQNESIKGKISEVEVMRSFYYYLLLDNYGDVPYLTSFDNAPAEPYKMKRQDVYDTLISTVTKALPYLKTIDNKYMVTRYMAFALLAKLYINSEVYTGIPQWQKAKDYCDSVIAGPYIFDNDFLAPFKTENQNNKEIIFSIPFDENDFQGFRLHMRTLHYQHNLKYDMPVGPWNGFCIVPDFFDKYELADKRREGYNIFGLQYSSTGAIIKDGETHLDLNINPHVPALYMLAGSYTAYQIRCTGARVGKYEIKKGAKENLSNDFPLFRLTDIKLMRSECLIRLGQNGDADVNDIRSRAGVSAWTGVGLDSLLAERGRELYCEGHRRQDLIRYGKFLEKFWGKDAVDDSPARKTFPIPKWATDANPNLLL